MVRFLVLAALSVATILSRDVVVDAGSVLAPSNMAQMLANAQLTREVVVCENTKYTIDCPAGQVLFIENAFYGRRETDKCQTGDFEKTDCRKGMAFKMTFNFCQGKSSCELDASQAFFGRVCRRTSKYLQVQYHCAAPDNDVVGNCFSNRWSEWIDSNSPDGSSSGEDSGDMETIAIHRRRNLLPCENPNGIQIRLVNGDAHPSTLGEVIETGVDLGVICFVKNQDDGVCEDYKVRYCCPGGGIIPTPPTTPAPIDCPLPSFGNGEVSGTGPFQAGDKVEFSCRNFNFELVGAFEATCLSDGQWSEPLPSCRKRDLKDLAICRGAGDPHYSSYDKTKYDYQGDCSYVLTRTIGGGSLPEFTVEVENEHRKNKAVSWLLRARVSVHGITIELNRGRRVTVDGELVNLPYSHNGGQVTIELSGRFVSIKTDFGMRILYDGVYFIAVGVPVDFMNNVEGLCGNYNGIAEDDFLSKDGVTLHSSSNPFAEEHKTPWKPGCVPPSRDEEMEECPPAERNNYSLLCEIMSDPSGPFNECNNKPDAESGIFVINCIFDMCAFKGSLEALANSITEYDMHCRSKKYNVKDWRTPTGTELECPANSRYSVCISACPKTCGNMNADMDCIDPCFEGCECKDGYVLSGDECVPVSQCGCTFEGKYYKYGETVVTNNCQTQCDCEEGMMKCQDLTCADKEMCGKDANGRQACVPTGSAKCKAWGDPHYSTFDGIKKYDFMGVCEYTMAETYLIPVTDNRWFHVSVQNEHRHGFTRVSYVDHVVIRLRGGRLVIILDKDGLIKVNGQTVTSAERSLFTLKHRGTSVVLETRFGLIVSFNGKGMRIQIPSTYMGKVRGLCGDYNGDMSDDYRIKDGDVTEDIDEFATSYQVGECADETVPPREECSAEDQVKWGGPEYCGRLLDGSVDSFEICNQVVDVTPIYESCVFDMCLTGGLLSEQINAYQEYSILCSDDNTPVCTWRDDIGVPKFDCPASSTYNGCATSCPDTCTNPFASANCDLSPIEACECDFGYVLEGKRCILRSECGCVVEGLYIPQGASIDKDDGLTRCSCIGSGSTDCVCKAGYQMMADGSCQDIDECIGPNMCEQKCTNTDGGYSCSCQDGYVLMGGKDCRLMQCPEPILVNGARHSDHVFAVGSIIEYMCNFGYVFSDGSLTKAVECPSDAAVVDIGASCIAADPCSNVFCGDMAQCSNGGCNCMSGYTGNPFVRCSDINECIASNNICGPNTDCVNLPGSYECNCFAGFRRVPDTPGCMDIDECAANTASCGRNSQCDNTLGGYECNCLTGFMRVPDTPDCMDIDECAANTASCGPNTDCVNTIGSYECNCFAGFMLVQDMSGCMDIDECAANTASCGPNTQCVNTLGSYQCLCLNGFMRVPDMPGCMDIDECAANTATCGPNTQCVNTLGSYQCLCLNGFMRVPDMPGCMDIDECAANTASCGPNTRCVNTPGSYVCNCLTGYMRVPDMPGCMDVDECSDGTSRCGMNERCDNTPGSYECNCIAGYRRVQDVCTEIPTMRDCPKPMIDNGEILENEKEVYSPGESVVFGCSDFKKDVVGADEVTCQEDGTWSPALPECQNRGKLRYCRGCGDPHYKTYDKEKYDMQGICSYVLTKHEADPLRPDLTPFQVEVDNMHRKSKRVSWLKDAKVTIYGVDIMLQRDYVVLIDGVDITLPYNDPQDRFTIRMSGRFLVLSTKFGLEVVYDGEYCISVGLPKRYQSAVEGLCGDCDEDPANDLMGLSPDEFALRHVTTRDRSPQCLPQNDQEVFPDNPCADEASQRVYENTCSVIIDINGVFDDCIAHVDAAAYYRDCKYDMCIYEGSPEALIDAVGVFAQVCQKNGRKIKNWREKIGHPKKCPKHSTHSTCGSACPKTCADAKMRKKPCPENCVEGCFCDEGYVLSGKQCVKEKNCGCVEKGNYYKNGDAFMDRTCTRRCECVGGMLSCESGNLCSSNERCGIDGNKKRACLPKERKRCRLNGNVHYKTFDGFGPRKFAGVCEYTLSHTHMIAEDDSSWYRVQVMQERRRNLGRIAFIKYIRIILRGGKVNIILEKGRVARVNGQVVTGARNRLYKIMRRGRAIVLLTRFGLRVRFNGKTATVRVPNTYKGKIRGMCGNYNGNPADDRMLRDGRVVSRFRDVAADYKVGQCVDDVPEDYVCTPEENAKWSTAEFCGALIDGSGAFKSCIGTVDNMEQYNICMQDVCATDGDREILLSNLEDYARRCQNDEVSLCDWRDQLGVQPFSCPARSTYAGCMTSCPDSCAEPSASATCDTAEVEGCECDFGYVRDGDRCVPKDQCGCVTIDGFYIRRGYSYDDSDNLQRCSCTSNGLECSCYAGYVYDSEGACEDEDECKTGTHDCHPNAKCTNNVGSFSCDCEDGFTGDGKTCEAETCDMINIQLPEGVLGPSSFSVRRGKVGRFRCRAGYNPVGSLSSEDVICDVNGKWGVINLRCVARQRNPCDEDECDVGATCKLQKGKFSCSCKQAVKANGEICSDTRCRLPLKTAKKITTASGAIVTRQSAELSCGKGYRLKPVRPIICMQGKKFPRVSYTCEDENECLNPFLNNCDRNADCINTLSGYTCRCQDGYQGNGEICNPTGPTTMCPLPTFVANAVVSQLPDSSGRYRVGDILRYSCKPGYRLNQPNPIIRCNENGRWSAPPIPIMCEVDLPPMCELPPTVEHAVWGPAPGPHGGYRVGQVVTYICGSGFKPNQVKPEITCEDTKQWSKPVKDIMCEEENPCSANPCGENENCVNVIPSGYVCNCRSGYTRDGVTKICRREKEGRCMTLSPGSVGVCADMCTGDYDCPGRQKCCSNGCGRQCRDPAPPREGNCKASFSIDCPGSDYFLTNTRCRGDHDCARPKKCCTSACGTKVCINPTPRKGNCPADSLPFIGINCVTECRNDYECMKPKKCCRSGCSSMCKFPEIAPPPTVDNCPPPPEVMNAGYSPRRSSYTSNTVITYVCLPGFRPRNKDTLSCKNDGTWDNSRLSAPFMCEDIDECSEGIDRCRIEEDCENTMGGHRCNCKAGYIREGATCRRKRCPRPNNIPNGRVVQNAMYILYGDDVTYECNVGYKLVNGPKHRRCRNENDFDGNVPNCHDINECDDPNMCVGKLLRCQNRQGGYDCVCPQGFKRGTRGCERDCPDYLPRPFCGDNACATAKCAKYPDAICLLDDCVTCRAEFYVRGNRMTDRQCHDDMECAAFSTCPNTLCSTHSCPQYPESNCVVDWCDCSEIYFRRNGERITRRQCAPTGSDVFPEGGTPRQPPGDGQKGGDGQPPPPGQPPQPGQKGDDGQPPQPPQPGQKGEGGQPPQPGQKGDGGQPPQPGQKGDGGQPPQPGQKGDGGQPPQPGQLGQDDKQPGQPDQPEGCIDPPSIINGAFAPQRPQDGWTVGFKVNFVCYPPYVPNFVGMYIECQANGQWSQPPQPFQCRRQPDQPDQPGQPGQPGQGRECENLDLVDNGGVSHGAGQGGYRAGQVVNLICQPGYTITPTRGIHMVHCLQNGQWSQPEQPVQCHVDIDQPEQGRCQEPSRLVNGGDFGGRPAGGWVEGQAITYTCAQGYQMSQHTVIKCQADGTWSYPAQMPTCNRIQPGQDGGGQQPPQPDQDGGGQQPPQPDQDGGGQQPPQPDQDGGGTQPPQPGQDNNQPGQPDQPEGCKDPPSIINGAFAPQPPQDGWTVGFRVNFVCYPPYVPNFVGMYIECQANGQWSQPPQPFQCRRQPDQPDQPGQPGQPGQGCGNLDFIENGGVSHGAGQGGYRAGQVVNLICQPGYTITPTRGIHMVHCLQNGQWSQPEQPAQCHVDIDQPEQGRCQEPIRLVNGGDFGGRPAGGWVEGQAITYTCAQGYQLSQHTVIKCQADGTWSYPAQMPTCNRIQQQRRTCVNPINIANGLFDPAFAPDGWVEGRMVKYRCNSGFQFANGMKEVTIQCQSNGQWSTVGNMNCVQTPVVQPPSVPQPPPVARCPNRDFSGTLRRRKSVWMSGDTVEFICPGGLSMDGSRTSFCQSDGTWSSPVPTCTGKVTCGDPTLSVANGVYDPNSAPVGGWLPDMTVTFRCMNGFRLRGTPTIECQDNGVWSTPAQQITCEDIDECRETFPCGGDQECKNTQGGYNCDCRGGFIGVGPSCRPVRCSNPGNIRAGVVSPNTLTFQHMDTITYSCQSGYELKNGPTRQCIGENVWSGLQPYCQDIDECSSTRGICKGNKVCSNRDGGYDCNCPSGYRIGQGQDCEQIFCPDRAFSGGRTRPNTNQWTVGMTANYECLGGATLIGSTAATCELSGSSGIWSSQLPACQGAVDPCSTVTCDAKAECTVDAGAPICTCARGFTGNGIDCKEIRCQAFPTPSHGRMNNPGTNYRPGQTIEVICHDGYQVVGGRAVTCLDSGRWDRERAECRDINECDNKLAHGCAPEATCSNSDGSFKCECPRNYRGDGRTCNPITCGQPQRPSNGQFNLSRNPPMLGTTVQYQCNNGYTPQGSSVAHCEDGGRWSNGPPFCQRVNGR